MLLDQPFARPVSEDDRAILERTALPVLVPGFERRRGGRPILVRTIALGVAVAHQNCEVAGGSGLGGTLAPERLLDVVPVRMDARMDRDDVLEDTDVRPRREPRREFVTIVGLDPVVQGVAPLDLAQAGKRAQRVDVVVAQHAARIQVAQQAQGARGIGTAVDQVTHGVQLIRCGIEAGDLEQALELLPASLNVSDEDPAAHGRIVRNRAHEAEPGLAFLAPCGENARMQDPKAPEGETQLEFPRVNGFWLLMAIVAFGMIIPILYRVLRDDMDDQYRAAQASLPEDPVERLAVWLEITEPQFMGIVTLANFSQKQPWIISHQMKPGPNGEPPQIWGVAVKDIPKASIFQEGMTVWVVLPEPTMRQEALVQGDEALGIPTYLHGLEIDGRKILEERFRYLYKPLQKGLTREFPDGRIRIACGGFFGEPEDGPGPQRLAEGWVPADGPLPGDATYVDPNDPGPGDESPAESD